MPGKSIPGKVKRRKTIDLANDLWVAPRPTHQRPRITPRTYEPDPGSSLNRYLEFADIALGVKQPGTRKRKFAKQTYKPVGEKPGPKLVSINHPNEKRGLAAFRNSR